MLYGIAGYQASLGAFCVQEAECGALQAGVLAAVMELLGCDAVCLESA